MNSALKVERIGKLKYAVDVAKCPGVCVSAEYQEVVPDVDDFIYYTQKRIKKLIALKYTKYIGVCEYNQKNHYLMMDIVLPPTRPFKTWKEKRQWAYSPDSPIKELMTIIESKMDDIIDDYESRKAKEWHCGDRLYEDAV